MIKQNDVSYIDFITAYAPPGTSVVKTGDESVTNAVLTLMNPDGPETFGKWGSLLNRYTFTELQLSLRELKDFVDDSFPIINATVNQTNENNYKAINQNLKGYGVKFGYSTLDTIDVNKFIVYGFDALGKAQFDEDAFLYLANDANRLSTDPLSEIVVDRVALEKKVLGPVSVEFKNNLGILIANLGTDGLYHPQLITCALQTPNLKATSFDVLKWSREADSKSLAETITGLSEYPVLPTDFGTFYHAVSITDSGFGSAVLAGDVFEPVTIVTDTETKTIKTWDNTNRTEIETEVSTFETKKQKYQTTLVLGTVLLKEANGAIIFDDPVVFATPVDFKEFKTRLDLRIEFEKQKVKDFKEKEFLYHGYAQAIKDREFEDNKIKRVIDREIRPNTLKRQIENDTELLVLEQFNNVTETNEFAKSSFFGDVKPNGAEYPSTMQGRRRLLSAELTQAGEISRVFLHGVYSEKLLGLGTKDVLTASNTLLSSGFKLTGDLQVGRNTELLGTFALTGVATFNSFVNFESGLYAKGVNNTFEGLEITGHFKTETFENTTNAIFNGDVTIGNATTDSLSVLSATTFTGSIVAENTIVANKTITANAKVTMTDILELSTVGLEHLINGSLRIKEAFFVEQNADLHTITTRKITQTGTEENTLTGKTTVQNDLVVTGNVNTGTLNAVSGVIPTLSTTTVNNSGTLTTNVLTTPTGNIATGNITTGNIQNLNVSSNFYSTATTNEIENDLVVGDNVYASWFAEKDYQGDQKFLADIYQSKYTGSAGSITLNLPKTTKFWISTGATSDGSAGTLRPVNYELGTWTEATRTFTDSENFNFVSPKNKSCIRFDTDSWIHYPALGEQLTDNFVLYFNFDSFDSLTAETEFFSFKSEDLTESLNINFTTDFKLVVYRNGIKLTDTMLEWEIGGTKTQGEVFRDLTQENKSISFNFYQGALNVLVGGEIVANYSFEAFVNGLEIIKLGKQNSSSVTLDLNAFIIADFEGSNFADYSGGSWSINRTFNQDCQVVKGNFYDSKPTDLVEFLGKKADIPADFVREYEDNNFTGVNTFLGDVYFKNNKWLKMQGNGDQILEFLDNAGSREGFFGRIRNTTTDFLAISNAIAGTTLALKDDGSFVFNDGTASYPIWHQGNDEILVKNDRANSLKGINQFASDIATKVYNAAAIQVRELNFAGTQTDSVEYAPRLAFHWSGRVASQIALNNDASISFLNNPGTGFETIKFNNAHAAGNYYISTAGNWIGKSELYSYKPYITGGLGTRSELLSNANFLIHADVDGSGIPESLYLRAGAGTANELRILSKMASQAQNQDGLLYNGFKVLHEGNSAVREKEWLATCLGDEWTTIMSIRSSNLAAGGTLTVQGTTNSVVVNAKFEILVNHSGDIYLEGISGEYTKCKIKVLSNTDDDFFIQFMYLRADSSADFVFKWSSDQTGDSLTYYTDNHIIPDGYTVIKELQLDLNSKTRNGKTRLLENLVVGNVQNASPSTTITSGVHRYVLAEYDNGGGTTKTGYLFHGKGIGTGGLTYEMSPGKGRFEFKGDTVDVGLDVKGKFYSYSNAFVGYENRFTEPSISLAIGDSDTGFDWISDGRVQVKANGQSVIEFNYNGIVPFKSIRSYDAICADKGFVVDNTNSGTKYGLSLYGSSVNEAINPNYGIMFTGTTGSGTHGAVTADWATYFTMAGTTSRGWIFRSQENATNVASISAKGELTVDKSAKVGKIKMEYNADTESLDFIFE